MQIITERTYEKNNKLNIYANLLQTFVLLQVCSSFGLISCLGRVLVELRRSNACVAKFNVHLNSNIIKPKKLCLNSGGPPNPFLEHIRIFIP